VSTSGFRCFTLLSPPPQVQTPLLAAFLENETQSLETCGNSRIQSVSDCLVYSCSGYYMMRIYLCWKGIGKFIP